MIDYCESPPEFISHTNQLSLEWDEPLFHDNSKKPLTVRQSHDFGFEFPFGETNVEYTATDASGNSASCLITIKLSSKYKLYFYDEDRIISMFSRTPLHCSKRPD